MLFRLSVTALIAAIVPVCLCPASAQNVSLEFTGEPPAEEVRETVRDALPDDPQAETVLEARRQANRAGEAIREALNAEAYYDPTIETAVEAGEPPKPMVRVDPGARFEIAEARIEFRGTPPRDEDAQAARDALEIEPGALAIPQIVIDQERRIANALREAGYPFAESQERLVRGDREEQTLSVTYRVRSGPRVRFGEVIVPDEIRTKPGFIEKLIPFEQGELYAPAQLATFNARLSETRMFDIARASLSETSAGTSPEGDDIRNIELQLEERARNTIGLGASIATDQGVGVNAEYTRRNLTGVGDTLTTAVEVAQIERSLDITWRRPHQFGYGRNLILSTGAIDEDTDAYDRRAIYLAAGVEANPSQEFGYSYGVRGELIREEDVLGERDLQLLSFYGSGRIDKTDSLLDPRKGWRAELRAEPTVAFGDSTSQFVKTTGQIRGYYPFDDARRFVLAGRLRLGSIVGAEVADIPVDRRYYAGGGGSIRGYAYQAIGPRAANNSPIGGRSLLESSIEARYRVRENIGVVAFVDAGNVTNNETPSFDDMRYGAGLGVRYSTPAGPLRLDVGVPLDKSEFDDPFQVYISIGQAF